MLDRETSVRLTLAGLMLGILISSMDNTIVATALGTVVADLGGMDKIVWVSAAYLIASVVGMPIFGKMSDMYGRKLFYVSGLGLFMLGSVLCGTAQDMVHLCLYRALQGLGGGALVPIAFTIVFDIYPPKQRGKIGGLLSAVYGISSIFGPLLGAYFADYASWRWIFYINIPLGLVSLGLICRFYFESLQHRRQRIDWAGALLLIASVLCLMLALQMGGRSFGWASATIMGLFLISALALLFLVAVERKAAEPIIPLDLFRVRLFASTQAAAFFTGACFIIINIYVPIFVQGVSGGTATNSGFVLMPMMLASVVGSQLGGMEATRRPYRTVMLVSGLLLSAGVILLSTLGPHTGTWLITAYMILAGLGMGISFPVLTMSSTHELPFQQRGTATASVNFFRTIGMTIGISLFGTIQKGIMLKGLHNALPGSGLANRFNDARTLLQPAVRAGIPKPVLAKMTAVLADSISSMYQWSIIAALAAMAAVWLMGGTQLKTYVMQARTVGGEANVDAADHFGAADGR